MRTLHNIEPGDGSHSAVIFFFIAKRSCTVQHVDLMILLFILHLQI